jgi:hypothetical protein
MADDLIKVHRQLFVIKGEGEQHWTLAERFGQMMSEAEEQFGPRDSRYLFVGVEFFNGEHPQLYHFWLADSQNWVTVRLPAKHAGDYQETVWQLAQETTHLLAPEVNVSNTFLEEGVATYFAVNYMKKHFWGADYAGRLHGDYLEAYRLTCDLMARCPQAVKNLRTDRRIIARIDRGAALQECVGEQELIDKLLRKFP